MATKMIEAGVELVTFSKILGYASIQMTMRYVHPTQESMINAVNKLGEIFKKPNDMVINGFQKVGVERPKLHLF